MNIVIENQTIVACQENIIHQQYQNIPNVYG